MQETIATLREVVLMPRDIPRVLPKRVGHGDDVVVLVHGFFASAGVFRPMKRFLVQETGAQMASFTHTPGMSVARIAQRLARVVDALPTTCTVHLVGHSLGGLAARWYVQELGGYARVAQTISLGSPFGGTTRADPFPILVGRDLCRTSPVLKRIRARAHVHDVPHTSILGDNDRLIVPNDSAIFPTGDAIVLPGRGHNSLLFDRESVAQIARCIQNVSGKSIDGEYDASRAA